jgi:hypothetical protein
MHILPWGFSTNTDGKHNARHTHRFFLRFRNILEAEMGHLTVVIRLAILYSQRAGEASVLALGNCHPSLCTVVQTPP